MKYEPYPVEEKDRGFFSAFNSPALIGIGTLVLGFIMLVMILVIGVLGKG